MRHALCSWGSLLLAVLFLRGRAEGQAPGAIRDAVIGETGEPTAEISTTELTRILADSSASVFDARPYPEYAVSHIPGALNVAPKPGVAPSATSPT